MTKYPAKEHASRVYRHFRSHSKIATPVGFCVLGESLELYQYCDQTKPLRQNRYFFYLSGVAIAGSHVLYDSQRDSLTLYLPEVDEDDIMWSGLPLLPLQAQQKFDVDGVKFAGELAADLKALGTKVYTTDINANNRHVAAYLDTHDSFFFALDELRMIKDEFELGLMRHAAKLTDNCHLAVMQATPIERNETHIHAEFMYHALRQGSKHQLYDPICCSGENCSTLHYVKNDDEIEDSKRLVLIDAGCEWECYASDVTRCFPINGDWTKEHLEIYRAVLRMQRETIAMIKPGAHWEDLHFHAHRVLIEEFLLLGIFKLQYSVDELFAARASERFFPHGLGHLLGMDTHDVGGRPNYADADPLLRNLRLRRQLQPGMVLTDEPGIYFSPFLLDDKLKGDLAQYVDRSVLDKYWYIGGVRIEDDLLVTKDGYENLTKITLDPEEISKIVKRGLARGVEGFHNVV